jgi:hypothetical protein
MKDLQNHQQEIHQIHQSLLQNKNENAEVITLLEKNFNLHLQSAQPYLDPYRTYIRQNKFDDQKLAEYVSHIVADRSSVALFEIVKTK